MKKLLRALIAAAVLATTWLPASPAEASTQTLTQTVYQERRRGWCVIVSSYLRSADDPAPTFQTTTTVTELWLDRDGRVYCSGLKVVPAGHLYSVQNVQRYSTSNKRWEWCNIGPHVYNQAPASSVTTWWDAVAPCGEGWYAMWSGGATYHPDFYAWAGGWQSGDTRMNYQRSGLADGPTPPKPPVPPMKPSS